MAGIYPVPDDSRCGMKVSWNYYKDEGKARECGKIAEERKWHYLSEGYDFGYCSPGSVVYQKEGPYAGMWEVCLP